MNLVTVSPKGQPPETRYRDMSGAESIRLPSELTLWSRNRDARKAADTTPK